MKKRKSESGAAETERFEEVIGALLKVDPTGIVGQKKATTTAKKKAKKATKKKG